MHSHKCDFKINIASQWPLTEQVKSKNTWSEWKSGEDQTPLQYSVSISFVKRHYLTARCICRKYNVPNYSSDLFLGIEGQSIFRVSQKSALTGNMWDHTEIKEEIHSIHPNITIIGLENNRIINTKPLRMNSTVEEISDWISWLSADLFTPVEEEKSLGILPDLILVVFWTSDIFLDQLWYMMQPLQSPFQAFFSIIL